MNIAANAGLLRIMTKTGKIVYVSSL